MCPGGSGEVLRGGNRALRVAGQYRGGVVPLFRHPGRLGHVRFLPGRSTGSFGTSYRERSKKGEEMGVRRQLGLAIAF